MTTMPIARLVGQMAAPTIVSMMVTNIYNLVDAYFVGKLGTSASGAIGVVLAVQMLIQATGFTFGHGAGSIIARKLGEHDHASAGLFASTSFLLSFLTGLVIMAAGLLFLDPLMRLLGSTETILPYARDYGRWILLAAPFMASSCVLNNIMRYEGHASYAMIGLLSGNILNMVGDPILMFGLGMGVSGAGLATALSQVVSFFVLLLMYLCGKTESKLSFRSITRKWRDVLDIVETGFPTLLRQGLNSVSTMLLNNAAAVYGDPAVAAMSIVGRISAFLASVMIGIGQGYQPVAAFNYGAKKYSRVRGAFRVTLLLGEIVLTACAALCFLLSPSLIQIFRDDAAVIAIGVPALRYQCISLVAQPIGVCTNMTFQSIGEKGKATMIALLRSGLFFIPLVLLLPRLLGLTGLYLAQPGSDVLSFIVSVPVIVAYLRRLPADV